MIFPASSPERRRRYARAGILLAGMAVTAAFLTIGLPQLTAPVRAPRESTCAVKAITTIHTAQVQYFSGYGRFAASLRELGPPASGAEGPSAAGLIERDLAGGAKCGYRFTLTATPTGYTISASPSQFGITGNKTYFSDPNMGIHVHNGRELATVDDPPLGETRQIR